MSLAGQRVWIIGAGFLGSVLASCCREVGARVLTIDAHAPADVHGSAADAAVLHRAMDVLVPDVVFCCAATRGGTPEDYVQSYLEPARLLGRVAGGARVVFCSSTSVYAARLGQVVTEETPLPAATGRSGVLLGAEAEVLRGGGVVARLAPLYGPARCKLVRRFMERLAGLPGSDSRVLNYLHVKDAARALMLLAALPALPERVFNVCGESFSRGDIYAGLEAVFGWNAAEVSSEPSVRGVSDMWVDSSRLRRLGWCPRHTVLELARQWKEES